MSKARKVKTPTKARAVNVVEQAEVFPMLLSDDEFYLVESIKHLALCGCHGGAHVYGLAGDPEVFVVSAWPLTGRQAHEVVDLYEEDVHMQYLIEEEGRSLEEALKTAPAATKKRWLKDPEKQKLAAELAASYKQRTAQVNAAAA